MSILPKSFKDAVVSIGIRIDNEISWIGTGFFLVKRNDHGNAIPFLVTNRHVLKDRRSIVIRMKERDSETLKIVDAQLFLNDMPTFKFHLNDKIDIAVIGLNADFITNNNL